MVAEPQLTVELDPLRRCEFALLLLELLRDIEQAFLHALRRHCFRQERQMVAEH